jgi:hypothetical protein
VEYTFTGGYAKIPVLPLGVVIVDVPETLALLEAKRVERGMPRVGAGAARILAENAEMMEVFVTPSDEDLEHEVEVGQRGVAAHKEATPNEGADASQDDAQLIDVGVWLVVFHEQSVRRNPFYFKGFPPEFSSLMAHCMTSPAVDIEPPSILSECISSLRARRFRSTTAPVSSTHHMKHQ